MDAAGQIREIIERLIQGHLRGDELLLHVEPILRQVSSGRAWQRQVDAIVNDVELATYTLNDPKRCDAVVEILKAALHLLGEAASK
ncbi:MAG TPA: hypothetical protein VGL61_03105 [Kofleriaceae bacterium]|jgi:hypothetical protein